MNDFQNIKRLLIPLFRGSPIVVGCFLLALVLGYRSVLYTNPVYESTAKMRLDDVDNGVSSTNLFKDFDVFAHTNKIAAEVEVLKSRLLTEKTLEQLDFGISYYRIGKIRTTELYHNSPFWVQFHSDSTALADRDIRLEIISDQSFKVFQSMSEDSEFITGDFGQKITFKGVRLSIVKNETLIQNKPGLHLVDQYAFRLNSMQHMVSKMVGGNLDVVAIDKDVAVLRISFKSEVPEKSALFVNTLAKTYINDYIAHKTEVAKKTVQFIDDQLSQRSRELQNSESNIEQYRNDEGIINTRQETETDLRKIAQLKIQLANMEMNVSALDSLHEYIENGQENFLELAPNFEAFTDLLSTEIIKKIKAYQAEKKDLLLKYTEKEEKVQVVDRKIEDLTSYLRESIRNTRNNLHIKKEKIAGAIKKAEEAFEGLPTKEKKMVVLQRDFSLNESIYNFLMQKRTEAAIAQAARMAFHRLIQQAEVPKRPISPKKTLIMIVCGMTGLIIGIAFIYTREFIGSKVRNRSEIEKIVSQPVIGVIRKKSKDPQTNQEEYQSLATQMMIQDQLGKNQKLLVSSTLSGEGKTEIVKNMGAAFASLGWKVLLVDLNLRKPGLDNPSEGISNVILQGKNPRECITRMEENLDCLGAGTTRAFPLQVISSPRLETTLNQLSTEYDLVIMDSPATAMNLDAIKLMKLADHIHFVARAHFTKSYYLPQADMLALEYGFSHIKILLNGVHRATNYNGNFTGSRFDYGTLGQSTRQKIMHYFKTYVGGS